MDVASTFAIIDFLSSPLTFGLLVGIAAVLVVRALMPSLKARSVRNRLDSYVDDEGDAQGGEMRESFGSRALKPLLRAVLRRLGRLAPTRNMESTRQKLIEAGEPGGLTVLDFYGLRLIFAAVFGGGYFLLAGREQGFAMGMRNTAAAVVAGYVLPSYWLRRLMSKRKHDIIRALPDALDMLTIGVEAGLAFESALLRVGQKWDNALTREFRRAVAEMRVGTPRDVALNRVAERTRVSELGTFIAVLVQSSQLGVSIAQVLHTQAAQMRVRRRQRAEELARQAGLKMVFALLVFVFPSMLVVILGPSIPAFLGFFANMSGGISTQ
jgi:tight adherence protein C